MSIASEISRLAQAKADIADAIENKGVTVSGAAKLDEYAALIDQIEGEGGEAPPSVQQKDVNFYDYDGTRLYSYTVEEAQLLTELPPLPTRDGLICQGWNYTLSSIQNMARACDVGAMYITDDGKTRLYIRVHSLGRATVPLKFSQTITNGVTIDWGDGTDTETLSGTSLIGASHTYTATGNYCITLTPASDCTFSLGWYSPFNWPLFGASYDYGYCRLLQYAEYGERAHIGAYSFGNCSSLLSVSIPDGTTTIGSGAFYGCSSLSSITIPGSAMSINGGTFYGCSSLLSITILDSMKTLWGNEFYNCSSLVSITIPDSVVSINNQDFANCTFMKDYFLYPTTPPTLSNINAFTNIPSDCIIHVPAASLADYQSAINWATYADYMVGDL